jgi:hypothetical protein
VFKIKRHKLKVKEDRKDGNARCEGKGLRHGDTEIKFVMLFARMVYYEEIWERSATKAKERNDRKGLELFV